MLRVILTLKDHAWGHRPKGAIRSMMGGFGIDLRQLGRPSWLPKPDSGLGARSQSASWDQAKKIQPSSESETLTFKIRATLAKVSSKANGRLAHGLVNGNSHRQIHIAVLIKELFHKTQVN